MRCLIFANGTLRFPEQDRDWLEWAELVVAANGGTRHALAYGRQPDLLIGDSDSLGAEARAALDGAATEVLPYPMEKDATDLDLAISAAVERGAQDIVVLGGIGSRWDQSVTNLLLGAQPAYAGIRLRLVDGPQQAELLRGGGSLTIHGQPGDLVSLIPVGDGADEIETQGLSYPLRRESLLFGASRGVSNTLNGSQASVSLGRGFLLCISIRSQDPAWKE